MIKVRTGRVSRVCQGDVLSDVEYVEYVREQRDDLEISTCTYPLVVVLTQDCDLQQDFSNRWSKKSRSDSLKLVSVLVAPLYNADQFFMGAHLSELGQTMATFNRTKTDGKHILQNQNPRYHYLEFPKIVPIVPSVVDFKHYFSLNGQYLKQLKKSNYVCKLDALYRESLCQRFAAYLARIALPEV